jgi:UDP-N-acetylglucosamine 2-epimerase (non-hydrolysing)
MVLKVMLVFGTRPQIIKSAAVIHEALKCPEIELQVVHTGQHYDFQMSRIFLEQLNLPNPVVNLEVGSGTHSWQTGEIMIRLEKALVNTKPNIVIVPGDTNSTLAGALVAAKSNIPLAHLEAGARSYDMTMPEEINRRLTDHCSNLLFAPTANCVKNLRKENVAGAIHLTGDTMYDSFLAHLHKAKENPILEELGVESDSYAVLTIHRPENVDNSERLANILGAMTELEELAIIFPAHPRTRHQLQLTGLEKRLHTSRNVRLVEPIGYFEMLKLMECAKLVFTDSGGMQKEAFWLGIPCITLRENTEWIETVQKKANILVGASKDKIISSARTILEDKESKKRLRQLSNPFGDGKASVRVVQNILRNVS